jgi:hypothetical protein
VSKSDEKPKANTRRTQGRRGTGRHPRGPVLQVRDEEILRWITRHGVVTVELVGRRFFWRAKEKVWGKWATYRRLRALKDLGLILTNKPFADMPAVLRVTREGARIADVGIRPAPLVESQLRHSLAVVWLTERLLYEHPGAELVTERELRAQRYREASAGEREPEEGRTADAWLRVPAKGAGAQGIKTVAIELDLSRKDGRAMRRMISQYEREPVKEVWWYVTPARVDRITEFVRKEDAADFFEVRAWHG